MKTLKQTHVPFGLRFDHCFFLIKLILAIDRDSRYGSGSQLHHVTRTKCGELLDSLAKRWLWNSFPEFLLGPGVFGLSFPIVIEIETQPYRTLSSNSVLGALGKDVPILTKELTFRGLFDIANDVSLVN